MAASLTNAVAGHAASSTPSIRCLAVNELLATVDAAQLAVFVEHAWKRQFALGECLFEAGHEAKVFTLVTSGLVKIVRTGVDWNDCILGIFGGRQSIGTPAVMRGVPYPASAYAVSERVEVIRIDARPVLAAMSDNPAVASALNRALLAHDEAMRWKIEIMSAGSVPRRLATLFLSLADRFGDEQEGGKLVLPVVLSRMELAALVGARVETVIRIASSWQKAGLLGKTQLGFELSQPEALRELLNSESRSSKVELC